MDIAELRKQDPAYKKKIHIYFSVFFAFAVTVFLAQNFLPTSDLTGGLFIPDSVNMSDTFDNLHQGNIFDILASGLIGMYYLYFIPWVIHPAICFLFNLVFIYYAMLLLCDLFVLNKIATSRVCLGIVLNPYLYLAMPGPNKEIPLILATLYVVRAILIKPKMWLVKSIIVAIGIIFIRDGYGAILLIAIAVFSSRFSINFVWKLGLLITFIAAVAFEFVLSNLSIFARNLVISNTIGQQNSAFIGGFLNSSNPFFSVIKQLLRMIYNLFTLSVFPAFTTISGSIYSIGCAYWVYGLLVASSIFASIYILATKKGDTIDEKYKIKLAGLVIFLWSAVSISLFVQPRYLMPFLPIAFGLLMSIGKNRSILLSMLVVIFSVTVITLYLITGHHIAEATPQDLILKSPSFLIAPKDI